MLKMWPLCICAMRIFWRVSKAMTWAIRFPASSPAFIPASSPALAPASAPAFAPVLAPALAPLWAPAWAPAYAPTVAACTTELFPVITAEERKAADEYFAIIYCPQEQFFFLSSLTIVDDCKERIPSRSFTLQKFSLSFSLYLWKPIWSISKWKSSGKRNPLCTLTMMNNISDDKTIYLWNLFQTFE